MSHHSRSSSPPHPLELIVSRNQLEIKHLQETVAALTTRLDNLTNLVMERLNQTANITQTPPPEPIPGRITPPRRHSLIRTRPFVDEETGSSSDSSDVVVNARKGNNTRDDDRSLKVDIPEFEGSLNPDDFLDWLNEIERIFDYKGYSDKQRCKVAILKFKDYASLWWENVKKKREREGKEKVKSWEKLMKLMKRRFLPDNHMQDLYMKLHTLKQGDKGVENYIREFERLMMRSDVPEPKEQTIARFIGGLDTNIAHMVELQPYCSFEDVCKLAIKIEKQRKALIVAATKNHFKGNVTFKNTIPYAKPESNTKDKGKGQIAESTKERPSFTRSYSDTKGKKCFKCHGYGHFQANCPNKE